MEVVKKLEKKIIELYKDHSVKLPFHGIHHVLFVYEKSKVFATDLKADLYLVSLASLTHDLNYLVKLNSTAESGKVLRQQLLLDFKVNEIDIQAIEKIIFQASTINRTMDICNEAKALSDADTLYKALPITPVVFASLYANEQKMHLKDLAKKIVTEQKTLMDKDIYFYSRTAFKYLDWAKVNLSLWENVLEYFETEDYSMFNDFIA